jgi:hypothetical protein
MSKKERRRTMNAPNEKELRALDALIAGAMLPEIRCANLSKEELDALIARKPEPLPEDMAALEKRGSLFGAKPPKPARASVEAPAGEMVMAMNRKNATDKWSDQTRSELERKARELLG